MYQQHFSLNELPFSIAPDPRYLYMSERHREALAHLLYGLQSNGAFILLTGDVGTGKTTVSRCLLEQLPAGTRLAMILNPMLSALELLQTICDELHISRPIMDTSIKVHVDCISRDLLVAHARGENTVVLIDEAQNLAPQVLEQLRLLTNLETAERKLLQIILLGQPELRDQLAQPTMSQLSQRITARYHLAPLSFTETRAYVQHRLLVASCREPLFGNASLQRLHLLSKGVPRLINVICDRALLGAYVQNKSRVNVATVNRAAQEVLGSPEQSYRTRYAGLAIAALILIVIALAYFVYKPPVETVVVAETPPQPLVVAPQPISHSPPLSAAQIVWPDADHALRSYVLAFQSLFNLWHFDYQPEQHGAPCFFAQLQALDCLSESGDFNKLITYNRPVILKLFDEHGDAQFAVLVALQDNTAIIDLAGMRQSLPATVVQMAWRGEFILLWQPPPGYAGQMNVGDAGNVVLWLRQKINQIDPQNPLPESAEYDEVLANRIKQFQLDQDLRADGVAGVQTLMHLNEVSGAVEPQLVKPAEVQG